MLYRKKPVEVAAIQYNGFNADEIDAFVGQKLRRSIIDTAPPVIRLVIPTLEGDHIASPGDWIIKGVKGEFYPCKPDIFELTYDPVED
jgi:hypothetical protein